MTLCGSLLGFGVAASPRGSRSAIETGPFWEVAPAWGYASCAVAPSREQETGFLRQRAEWLKGQLDAIAQRIEEPGEEE